MYLTHFDLPLFFVAAVPYPSTYSATYGMLRFVANFRDYNTLPNMFFQFLSMPQPFPSLPPVGPPTEKPTPAPSNKVRAIHAIELFDPLPFRHLTLLTLSIYSRLHYPQESQP